MEGRSLLRDLSFLIPVRIETKERLENLKAATDYLLKFFDTNIIILEAAPNNSGLLKTYLSPVIDIHFVEDNDIIFHRTKYLNLLTKKAKTPFIAVWDTDVIVPLLVQEYSIYKYRKSGAGMRRSKVCWLPVPE